MSKKLISESAVVANVHRDGSRQMISCLDIKGKTTDIIWLRGIFSVPELKVGDRGKLYFVNDEEQASPYQDTDPNDFVNHYVFEKDK